MNNIIAISGNILNDNGSKKSFANDSYIQSVVRANGIPVIMPIIKDKDIIKKTLENVSGVIMTGGVDIHPFYFNQEPHPKIGTISKERDEFDFTVLDYAFKMKKPILGICRGIQLINVYFGGDLIQDIESQTKSNILHSQTAPTDVATHKIKIEKTSILYDLLGEESEVNSFHHQAIGKIAKDFNIVAKANDDIIEAIEYKDKNHFILALQWHPELMSENDIKMQNIFNKFVFICGNNK